MSELPNKHVFVPQPPTEGERLAWNTVKASGEATKQLHDKLTAAQSRIDKLTARWAVLTSELDKSVVETVERVSDENLRLRALLQKAHDEFAKTDHWYHSDIKEELAKELGL